MKHFRRRTSPVLVVTHVGYIHKDLFKVGKHGAFPTNRHWMANTEAPSRLLKTQCQPGNTSGKKETNLGRSLEGSWVGSNSRRKTHNEKNPTSRAKWQDPQKTQNSDK